MTYVLLIKFALAKVGKMMAVSVKRLTLHSVQGHPRALVTAGSASPFIGASPCCFCITATFFWRQALAKKP